MEVIIIPNRGGEAAQAAITYTEPSLTKKGLPIENLKVINIYIEIPSFGVTNPISKEAISQKGGNPSEQNMVFLPGCPDGEKTTIKVWGVAINTDDQESDRSEIVERVVNRSPLDPMDAPMPPQ